MVEGLAALFMVLGLAAFGRFIDPAFAVLGRFTLFPPGLDARLGRLAGMLLPPFGRLAAARLLPRVGAIRWIGVRHGRARPLVRRGG